MNKIEKNKYLHKYMTIKLPGTEDDLLIYLNEINVEMNEMRIDRGITDDVYNILNEYRTNLNELGNLASNTRHRTLYDSTLARINDALEDSTDGGPSELMGGERRKSRKSKKRKSRKSKKRKSRRY